MSTLDEPQPPPPSFRTFHFRTLIVPIIKKDMIFFYNVFWICKLTFNLFSEKNMSTPPAPPPLQSKYIPFFPSMKLCKTICNKFQQNLIRKVCTNLDCNFRHAFGEVWTKFTTQLYPGWVENMYLS